MGMGKLTVKVTAVQKWWVRPLMLVAKLSAFARLMREKDIPSLSRFIAIHGYDYRVEK